MQRDSRLLFGENYSEKHSDEGLEHRADTTYCGSINVARRHGK